MKRLLLILGMILVFASACHYQPVYFADGSWVWAIGDHDPSSENYIPTTATHAQLFGCLNYNRSQYGDQLNTAGDCTVNTATDHMTGAACAWHPDGVAGCKGLLGAEPPEHKPANNCDVTHLVDFYTGTWNYVSQHQPIPCNPSTAKYAVGCLDTNGPTAWRQWPC